MYHGVTIVTECAVVIITIGTILLYIPWSMVLLIVTECEMLIITIGTILLYYDTMVLL